MQEKILELNKVHLGDCFEILKNNIPDNSIDLIFTSPPYAERRKKTYGGVSADKYVEWFLPIASELKRILKPTGSFFLNIKPDTNEGERRLYVFELVIALKKELGFLFVDEYCWTKNAFPGALKGRFKNGFEPVYHFTKISPNDIKFHPIACGTPIKEESLKRARRKQSGTPDNGSGMAALRADNLLNIVTARPSNVINVNNVSNQFSDKKLHSGTFPEGLPEFFIKSFTNIGDVVLDPFSGSGTTGLVAKKLNRDYILIDKEESCFELSKKRTESYDHF